MVESAKARLAKGREEIAQVALDYLNKQPGVGAYTSQLQQSQDAARAGLVASAGVQYSGGGLSNAVYSNAADVLSKTSQQNLSR